MKKIPEAAVAICKCSNTGKLFGLRFQKEDKNLWDLTWAFTMEQKTAEHEGYDTTIIKGHINVLRVFPGCPYCGHKGIFVCGCGKLNCVGNDFEQKKKVKCKWCGKEGTLSAYDGQGIKSGRDR